MFETGGRTYFTPRAVRFLLVQTKFVPVRCVPHESVKMKKYKNQLELSITNTHVGMANRESKQSHKLSFTMTLISYLQECEGSLCYSGTM